MTLTTIVRIARVFGWAALIGSVGVIVYVLCVQCAGGPVEGQTLMPSPRLWRCIGNSLWMASGAAIAALILSLPAAIALVQARRSWQRAILRSLCILPLLTMPSIYAYAWLLLATSRTPWVRGLFNAIGANTRGYEPLQAAFVFALWLWPIPAFLLAAAFRHTGARAYQLARLDTSSVRAFLRAALPAMRAPLIAAVMIVFILALLDSTIPPLVQASDIWSKEVLAQAETAMQYQRPAAYLLFSSWPMLALVGLCIAMAAPGLRRMAAWTDEPVTGDTGTTATGRSMLWLPACLIAALVTLLPIAVFAAEMRSAEQAVSRIVHDVWLTSSPDILASLLVAGVTGVLILCGGIALLDDSFTGVGRKTLNRIVIVLAACVAILPPELTATAMAWFYSAEWISPRGGWNLYDNSPIVWVLAEFARFGIIAIAVVRLVSRRGVDTLTDQAAADGATAVARVAHAKLPIVAGPLLASAAIAAFLTLSESRIGQITRPPQFFGGSYAAAVDAQLHFGRGSETTIMCLLLMLPATLAVLAWPLLSGVIRSVRATRCADRMTTVQST